MSESPFTFSVRFRQAENYPVDLYYVMDMSKSMDDDKRRLAQLGDLLGQYPVYWWDNIMEDIECDWGTGVGRLTRSLATFPEVDSSLKDPQVSLRWTSPWNVIFLPSVPWRCGLGDRKGIQPVKCWVLVGWWRWFDWSFAHLTAPVVTTTSIILSYNKIQNRDILVPTGCPGKWRLKRSHVVSCRWDSIMDNMRLELWCWWLASWMYVCMYNRVISSHSTQYRSFRRQGALSNDVHLSFSNGGPAT